MKKVKLIVLIALLPALLFFGCDDASTDAITTDEDSTEEVVAEDGPQASTNDNKAAMLYRNTTVLFVGVMTIAFNEAFQGMAASFAETFANFSGDEASLKEVDDKIEELDDEIVVKLDEAIAEILTKFDEAVEENKEGFDKMFAHEVWDEGISTAEGGKLPGGFMPLTANLNQSELWRYILYVSSRSNEEGDPLVTNYQELMQWLQAAGPKLEADPEIKAFIDELKAKNKGEQQ